MSSPMPVGGSLVHIDPVSGAVVSGSSPPPATSTALASSLIPGGGSIVHVDPATGAVVPGGQPSGPISTQNAGVLQSIIDNLLNTEATALKDQASSTAQQEIAAGDKAEGLEYQNAADIAAGNADIARASGQIQQFQSMRKAMQTIGEQRATVAGAGFGNSGSALLLAQDSMRQANLQDQIIGENSQLQESGFLEQSAASKATAAAAGAAGDAALTLSVSDAQTATLLKADAAAEAAALAASFPGTPQASIAGAAATGQPLSPADLTEQAKSLTGTALNPTPLDTSTHFPWGAVI